MQDDHANHNQDHGHGHNHIELRKGNGKSLTIAILVTFSIMILEIIGGFITNSLALLSDSGHMLSDVVSLGLSLLAVWFAARPPSASKSFGYYRVEILTALFNGATLFIISGWIIWEAYHRFMAPPTVDSGLMMLIAVIGLLANLLSAWILLRQGDIKGNINLRSAYIHVLGDALGSVGAIIAGVLMYQFSWYIADPIISVIVAVLILRSAWNLIKESIHILMEGIPSVLEMDNVKMAMQSIRGVLDVHDLHIWTVTSGRDLLTCHVRIDDTRPDQEVLQEVLQMVYRKFKIEHATIQIENALCSFDDLSCAGCNCVFAEKRKLIVAS